MTKVHLRVAINAFYSDSVYENPAENVVEGQLAHDGSHTCFQAVAL